MTLMNEKVCMVTGATAGIGAVASQEIARTGATVVVVGRNPDKCAATVAQIKQQTGNPRVDFLLADLSVQQSIHELAAAFKTRYARLDVLLNNAGAVYFRRQESADGIELTFALNHLNYFLLTHLLIDMLKAAASARIVNVASGAHQGNKLDFDDLEARQRYQAFSVYGRSKLANILFTYELARRLANTNITANALHPGFVATSFGKNNGWLGRILMNIVHRFAIGPAEGARTPIYLATAPAVAGVTGKYWEKEKAVASSPESYDKAAAQRLWHISEQLTGISSSEFGLGV
jgi:NAD(P)-dependent dehydrogenase (short-subunit alcohol dehydrogenase family)